jgi:hypothetical protein
LPSALHAWAPLTPPGQGQVTCRPGGQIVAVGELQEAAHASATAAMAERKSALRMPGGYHGAGAISGCRGGCGSRIKTLTRSADPRTS